MASRIRFLYFFTFCCQAAWLPRYADFLTKKGFAGWELGFLMSVPPAMMFVAQPIFGAVADRVGHRKTLLFSAAMAAVFLAAHVFLDADFWLVAAVAAAMALFFNATQPVVDALALGAAEKNPKVDYGSLRFWGAAAWSATGLFLGFLIEKKGLEAMFWTASAAMGLTFLAAFSMPDAPKKTAEKAASLAQDFKKMASIGRVLAFLAVILVVSVAQTPVWNFYSLYMDGLGDGGKMTGWGLALQGLCELPLFFFASKIIEKMGLKRAFLLALAATGLRMWLYSLAKTPFSALPIEVLHGLSWSLFWVVAVETMDKLTRSDQKATGQSLLYAAYFGLGAIGGNFWASFLAEKMSLGQVFLLNAGIVAAVGAAVFFSPIFEKKAS